MDSSLKDVMASPPPEGSAQTYRNPNVARIIAKADELAQVKPTSRDLVTPEELRENIRKTEAVAKELQEHEERREAPSMLRDELNEAEDKMSGLQATYTENEHTLIEFRAELEELNQRLAFAQEEANNCRLRLPIVEIEMEQYTEEQTKLKEQLAAAREEVQKKMQLIKESDENLRYIMNAGLASGNDKRFKSLDDRQGSGLSDDEEHNYDRWSFEGAIVPDTDLTAGDQKIVKKGTVTRKAFVSSTGQTKADWYWTIVAKAIRRGELDILREDQMERPESLTTTPQVRSPAGAHLRPHGRGREGQSPATLNLQSERAMFNQQVMIADLEASIRTLKRQLQFRKRRYIEGEQELAAMRDRYETLRVELTALRSALAELTNGDTAEDLKAEIRFYKKERYDLYSKLYWNRTVQMPPVKRLYTDDDGEITEKPKGSLEEIKEKIKTEVEKSNSSPEGRGYQLKVVERQRKEMADMRDNIERATIYIEKLHNKLQQLEIIAMTAQDSQLNGRASQEEEIARVMGEAQKMQERLLSKTAADRQRHAEERKQLESEIDTLRAEVSKMEHGYTGMKLELEAYVKDKERLRDELHALQRQHDLASAALTSDDLGDFEKLVEFIRDSDPEAYVSEENDSSICRISNAAQRPARNLVEFIYTSLHSTLYSLSTVLKQVYKENVRKTPSATTSMTIVLDKLNSLLSTSKKCCRRVAGCASEIVHALQDPNKEIPIPQTKSTQTLLKIEELVELDSPRKPQVPTFKKYVQTDVSLVGKSSNAVQIQATPEHKDSECNTDVTGGEAISTGMNAKRREEALKGQLQLAQQELKEAQRHRETAQKEYRTQLYKRRDNEVVFMAAEDRLSLATEALNQVKLHWAEIEARKANVAGKKIQASPEMVDEMVQAISDKRKSIVGKKDPASRSPKSESTRSVTSQPITPPSTPGVGALRYNSTNSDNFDLEQSRNSRSGIQAPPAATAAPTASGGGPSSKRVSNSVSVHSDDDEENYVPAPKVIKRWETKDASRAARSGSTKSNSSTTGKLGRKLSDKTTPRGGVVLTHSAGEFGSRDFDGMSAESTPTSNALHTPEKSVNISTEGLPPFSPSGGFSPKKSSLATPAPRETVNVEVQTMLPITVAAQTETTDSMSTPYQSTLAASSSVPHLNDTATFTSFAKSSLSPLPTARGEATMEEATSPIMFPTREVSRVNIEVQTDAVQFASSNAQDGDSKTPLARFQSTLSSEEEDNGADSGLIPQFSQSSPKKKPSNLPPRRSTSNASGGGRSPVQPQSDPFPLEGVDSARSSVDGSQGASPRGVTALGVGGALDRSGEEPTSHVGSVAMGSTPSTPSGSMRLQRAGSLSVKSGSQSSIRRSLSMGARTGSAAALSKSKADSSRPASNKSTKDPTGGVRTEVPLSLSQDDWLSEDGSVISQHISRQHSKAMSPDRALTIGPAVRGDITEILASYEKQQELHKEELRALDEAYQEQMMRLRASYDDRPSHEENAAFQNSLKELESHLESARQRVAAYENQLAEVRDMNEILLARAGISAEEAESERLSWGSSRSVVDQQIADSKQLFALQDENRNLALEIAKLKSQKSNMVSTASVHSSQGSPLSEKLLRISRERDLSENAVYATKLKTEVTQVREQMVKYKLELTQARQSAEAKTKEVVHVKNVGERKLQSLQTVVAELMKEKEALKKELEIVKYRLVHETRSADAEATKAKEEDYRENVRASKELAMERKRVQELQEKQQGLKRTAERIIEQQKLTDKERMEREKNAKVTMNALEAKERMAQSRILRVHTLLMEAAQLVKSLLGLTFTLAETPDIHTAKHFFDSESWTAYTQEQLKHINTIVLDVAAGDCVLIRKIVDGLKEWSTKHSKKRRGLLLSVSGEEESDDEGEDSNDVDHDAAIKQKERLRKARNFSLNASLAASTLDPVKQHQLKHPTETSEHAKAAERTRMSMMWSPTSADDPALTPQGQMLPPMSSSSNRQIALLEPRRSTSLGTPGENFIRTPNVSPVRRSPTRHVVATEMKRIQQEAKPTPFSEFLKVKGEPHKDDNGNHGLHLDEIEEALASIPPRPASTIPMSRSQPPVLDLKSRRPSAKRQIHTVTDSLPRRVGSSGGPLVGRHRQIINERFTRARVQLSTLDLSDQKHVVAKSPPPQE